MLAKSEFESSSLCIIIVARAWNCTRRPHFGNAPRCWSVAQSVSQKIENEPFHFREIQSLGNLTTNLMSTIALIVDFV